MPPQRTQENGITPLTFDRFQGVQTATDRAGVPDEQAYWLDGFMPLAERNLRTLYGIGSALYSATGGKTIIAFYFYNIGSTPYAALFISDGSLIQVNTQTGAATTILTAGSIFNPVITNMGVAQYGQQYLITVANQTNGYWVWDGSILYSSGTLAPGVILTNPGEGYVTPPVVTATGGNGSGATFVATIANGIVTNVLITNPGSGYRVGDSVSLVFTGGTASGTGATAAVTSMTHIAGGTGALATASITFNPAGYFVVAGSIQIFNPGSNYSSLVQAIPTHTGVGSVPVFQPILTSGSITSISVISVGRYNGPAFSFSVSIVDAGYFQVAATSMISDGSGYGPAAAVNVLPGGASFSVLSEAVLTPVLSATPGSITSVAIQNGGYYGTSIAPSLSITDTAISAAGKVALMPFGIQGTAVATYAGHVWVFNGNVFNFTAPGSVGDFATSDGGGSDQTNNSYLKVGYVGAVNTNGFLFLIGDSSMDYISGVVTSGSVATTTFNQNNSDPEIGTPYPAAITTLGENIVIANSTGIFVSSGGTFNKISEPLDGVFNTVPASQFNANPFNGFQLSTAKATIFGKRVWMVLAPIIDPVKGTQVNKLLMFRDKKLWWTSEQDVGLTFIQGQEINSVFQAWGTDGTNLYPLFNMPSAAFMKTAQSRLWDEPMGIDANKAASRFWSVWNTKSTVSTSFTLTMDGVGIDASGNQYTNSNTYSIAGPVTTGYFVTPPQAVGQNGVLTGMTIITQAADTVLVIAKIAEEIVQDRT